MNVPLRLVAIAAALLLCAAGAAAQDEEPPARDKGEPQAAGYLTAFACGELRQPLRVEVKLMDDTKINMQLRDVFVDQLKKSGAEITPGATLVLSLDIETIREGERRKPGDMVDLRVGSDDPDARIDDPMKDEENYARAHVNIWSNRRDSVLGGRRDTVEQQAINELRVTVDINSRQDGRCLWHGEAVHQLDSHDTRIVGERVMRAIADNIGKRASREPISPD